MRYQTKWIVRIVAILMVALLVLGMVASYALAAPGDATLLGADDTSASQVFASVAAGGKLYAVTDGKIVLYEGIGDDPQPVDVAQLPEAALENISSLRLVSDGTAVYLLDAVTGVLYQVADEDIAEVVTLDFVGAGMSQESDGTFQVYLFSPLVVGDNLLVLYRDLANFYSAQMLSFSLSDGSAQMLGNAPAALMQLSLYKEGQLLAVENEAYTTNSAEARPRVVVLDSATGGKLDQLAQLPELSDGCVAYDEENDVVYAVSGGQVVRLDAGALTPVNYLNSTDAFGTGYIGVVDGFFVYQDYNGIRVRNTDPQYMAENPLRISGMGIGTSIVEAFAKEHPEIPVMETTNSSYTVEAITQSMISGENAADIYEMNNMMDLDALIKKGYVPAIESEALLADVQTMYPQLQDLLIRDGKLYAYPVYIQMIPWSVRTDLLEEFGFDMPRTLQEYYELMVRWYDEFADDETEVNFENLLNGGIEQVRLMAISNVLYQYAMTYETADAPLSFDTPEFRGILEAVEQLPYEAQDEDGMMLYITGLEEDNYIFNNYPYDYLYLSGPDEEKPREYFAPFAIVEGEDPAMRTFLYFYTINPNSQNQEQALTYLEFAAQNLADQQETLLHPDKNELVDSASYLRAKEEADARLADLTAQLEAAAEADRQAIQDEIDKAQVGMEELEKNRYEISEYSLSIYREIAQYMNLLQDVALIDPDNQTAMTEINNVIYSYLAGQMPMEQAIRELDNKLRAMYQEGL